MRACGILMPVFSLPGPFGIGTLGKEAFAFVDFLAGAKQTYWQILPIGPTGYGDSPYQSFSAFAGNPYFIDYRLLVEQGFLTQAELPAPQPVGAIDYGALYRERPLVLKKAADRLLASPTDAYHTFCTRQDFWLEDYALFMAIKAEQHQAGLADWPDALRTRQPEALAAARARLAEQVDYHKAVQFFFYTQWNALKAYANAKGVQLVGDIPIYVSPDSSDLWTHPELFQTDGQVHLTQVAGCPPDAFAADGQLWGNPLYDWDAMRADGFRWWKERIRGAAKRYDVVRIDHFRAISSYWVVPRGELTARGGHWAPGPGPALLQALHTAAPELQLIAEDLGTIDDDVRRLVARSGCPGMRVLLFGFDPGGTSEHRPDRVRAHSVCYVGTHDNAPAAAWAALGGADADYAMRCLGVYDVARLPEALLRAGMGSRAELFIAQMQDVLGLGAESRMNTPGTASGNWVWRLLPGQADAQTAARLLARTQAACRI